MSERSTHSKKVFKTHYVQKKKKKKEAYEGI